MAPDDTIAYLRQLEVPLRTVGDGDEESLEILVSNAHAEIANSQASLCVHAKSSVVIEALLRRSNTGQLVAFAASLTGYIPYLLKNTYASHAMQTLVSLLAAAPLVSEASIAAICAEVDGQWLELASDASATHPLRLLVQVLCGAAKRDEGDKKAARRGKQGETAKPEGPPAPLAPVPAAFTTQFQAVLQVGWPGARL